MRIRNYLFIGLAVVAVLCAFYLGRGSGLSLFPGEGNSTSTPLEAGMREVSVYFLNSKMDPEVTCTRVFPVTHTVEDTPLSPRKAIEELLGGPKEDEGDAGYETALPPGVTLNNLIIQGTVATADFNDALSKVAGSCTVTAIAAQISETLKQFSPIRTVVITINGRSEDVLQP